MCILMNTDQQLTVQPASPDEAIAGNTSETEFYVQLSVTETGN